MLVTVQFCIVLLREATVLLKHAHWLQGDLVAANLKQL